MEEIITTAAEEAVEATEEIAAAYPSKFVSGFATGAAAAIVGVFAYSIVVKPLAKLIKEKVQQRKAEREAIELDAEDYDISESENTEEE